jgi:hypothetical protein
MFKPLLCIVFFFVSCNLFAQSAILINTYEPQNQSVRIVAHTDSSILLLCIKAYEKGKSDFYISNKPVNKNIPKFDTCLQIAKLFGGKLDPKTFKHRVFQCNDHVIFVFDVYVGTHKKVIAKAINFNGIVSDAFVLDDSDLSNTELMECNYTYELTDKKELLITLRRKYKSGFQRDKCILYNEHMNKLWEYEFPKINHHYEVNVLTTVYNSNQLIYRVANGFLDKNGNEWIIKHDYDTIIKKTIDGLIYNLKVPKDSLCLMIVNPIKQTASQVKVYWPFKDQGIITPISSSQIILYDLVDIDDAKFILPGKKAMYYKRIDIKNNVELYENLIPLDKKNQDNLTYNMLQAESKPFGLLSEKIVDGKLFSLFVNQFYNEAEVIVSCFDISLNKFEWLNLLPRKLSTTSHSSINALTFSYSNKKIGIGYYENKRNFETPINLYKHKKYKMVRGYEDSNFIEVTIDGQGNPSKKIVNESSEAFLFPWLYSVESKNSNHFFESHWFFPIKYFYRTQ